MASIPRERAAAPASTGLKASTEPLCRAYDCAMLDLDGVVYRGQAAIPEVPDLLRRARAAGMTRAFVTNNAARTPESVAAHLRSLGVEADASDIVTSAQAAARELATMLSPGALVLVVGGEGLQSALQAVGLVPVTVADPRPAAVVQGFSADVGWRQLATASYLVASGLPWVATNLDRTIPTTEGIAPGNGMLVAAVAVAGGRDPDVVAGKPYRPLFDETVLRTGAQHPLMVGDRLDTDIEGAVTCGADSLLVMTGVTDVRALCAAPVERRPSYVAWTLSGLLTEHALPTRSGTSWRLGDWSLSAADARLLVETVGDDRDNGLRAVCAAAWHWHDTLPPKERGATLDVTAAAEALQVP